MELKEFTNPSTAEVPASLGGGRWKCGVFFDDGCEIGSGSIKTFIMPTPAMPSARQWCTRTTMAV